MRKLPLLLVGAAFLGGTLVACVGTKPPPPPPVDPKDVLVVGDSISFSFGCVLGDASDPLHSPSDCPPRPGYTTHNESQGACTITPGTLLLYNGGTFSSPHCDTQPDGQDRTWAQAADYFTPKVVVVHTSGYEIVDRWINGSAPPPDAQWGGPTNESNYQNAAARYANELSNAINMFLSKGAKVVVANAPYIQPLQPEPPPSQVPSGFGCVWWEPYPDNPPTSTGPDCTGNATPGSGGTWRPPASGVTYRSSRTKLDQLNDVITSVTSQFQNDSRVVLFDFKRHFNGPNNVYTDYVCPPPNDSTVIPDPVTHECVLPDSQSVDAILARADDHGHLSPAGMFQILQYYLEPCVKALLGIGGDASKCT